MFRGGHREKTLISNPLNSEKNPALKEEKPINKHLDRVRNELLNMP
jgi:hypothetical protein